MNKSIAIRAFLGAALGAGIFSTAAAMAADPPACGGVVGTPEEIAATPRHDVNLEQLSLSMASGLTAGQELYDRVVADVGLIRALFPEVANISHRPRATGQDLILEVDDPTYDAIISGTYTAWDCLNDYYGFEWVRGLSDLLNFVLLRLKGTYDTSLLVPLYTALPEIENGWPDAYLGDGPTICGLVDSSSTHHYFFVDARGDCPSGCTFRVIHYLTTRTAGAFPEYRGLWPNEFGEPQPPWVEIYEQCEYGDNPLPARIDVTPAAPYTGDPVVLTVTGEGGNTACGPFFDRYELDLDTNMIRVSADFNESCGPCTPDVTPYAFDVDLGGLAAGDYQVTFFSRDGCQGQEELLALTELTVRLAPTTDIPTLDVFGLGLLALLVAVVGWTRIRRTALPPAAGA